MFIILWGKYNYGVTMMSKSAQNLKRIMEYMDIPNVTLAKCINVDASLVSRWLSSKRQLKLSSGVLQTLTEYLLDKTMRANSTDWLKQQMELDGLAFDYSANGNLLKALKLWLSSDGEEMSKSMDLLPMAQNEKTGAGDSDVKTGFVEIALFLEKTLAALPCGTKIDIHLSSEDTAILLHESISRMLLNSMLGNNNQVRLLVSMSSGVTAMSRLLTQYTQALIEGTLNLAVVHGMTQAITNQATFIIENNLVFIVCETPKNIAPPIGTAVHDASFIKESQKSFERAYNFSQPLIQRFNDNLARNVLELFYHEYATPGNLDVMKDNINPLFMDIEDYCAFLKRAFGYKGEQLKWRRVEIARFMNGLQEILGSGSVYREMISLKRINQIVKEGQCKMPGLYFLGTGIAYLDAKGCLSLFEGYIAYLQKYPDFHLTILDEITELNDSNCWHIKQNHHWMLNGWSREENITLFTNQLMLLHEFQTQYNEIWKKADYSEGRRRQTIKTLQESIRQLKESPHLS